MVAAVHPFGPEMTVLAYQADFRILTLLRELLRGIDRKQQSLALRLIGAEFLAVEFDDPVIVVLEDQLTG